MNRPADVTEPRHLRVEIVSDTYVPDINGVARSLGRIADGLREIGHEVTVIRSGAARGPHEAGVPSWPLPGYWEIRVGAPWPGWFRRRWRRSRPDVVYVAIETPLGLAAATAAIRLGIPAVGGFHTNFRQYLHRYGLDRIAEKVWLYQKWFHNRLARTLVPSPETRDALAAAGFARPVLLGRGVDADLYQPSRRSRELRASWGAGEETPVAIVVGRVSPEKNIELALEAIAAMRRDRPDVVGVVVGDGPARANLERDHPEVRFTGYRTGGELATHYASGDILLFPSETETFGNVLLEGMASGLACVACDHAAAKWHGRDGENLLKVPPGDGPAFVAASARLLDASLRAGIAREARVTAESLSWSAISREFESALRSAMREA